jgi:Flp pilus assembly protein protease CpaA
MSTAVSCLLGTSCGLLLTPVVTRLVRATAHENELPGLHIAAIGGWMGGVGAAAGARPLGATTALLAAIAVLGTAAAEVDVLERRLPDRLTGTLALAVAGVGLLTMFQSSEALQRMAVAATVTIGTAGLLLLVAPAAMGWGDLKLVPSLAAATAAISWPCFISAVGLSSVLLLSTASANFLRRRNASLVPYGPSLVGAASFALGLSTVG